MFKAALISAISYFLVSVGSNLISIGAQRPIFIGWITGILCGDMKTGIIIGCECEAIYMGVNAIGGVRASNTQAATTFAVTLAVFSDADIETAMALAVTVGLVLNSLSTLTGAIANSLQSIYERLSSKGNIRGYSLFRFVQAFLVTGTQSLLLFICTYLGATGVQAFFDKIPGWVMTGLKASSNCLVVVGLCLTTQCIWTPDTPFWVILGFVLSKNAGLGVLPIAAIGTVIAYFDFRRNYENLQREKKYEAMGSLTAKAETPVEGVGDLFD